MKYINKYKSPNFNLRKKVKIKYIIIHYTALDTAEEAIEFLCNKKNKVSSHYLISKKGLIFNLVDERKRAWHAGKSYWKGDYDINSFSIGIELDFNPEKNKKYSHKLINSLIFLLNKLKKKYNIKKENILGHSDVSPYRKIDPGINFPWKKLGIFRDNIKNIKKIKMLTISLNNSFKYLKITKRSEKILFILAYLGYDISQAKLGNKKLKNLVRSYKSKFMQGSLDSNLDEIFFKKIKEHFVKDLLKN